MPGLISRSFFLITELHFVGHGTDVDGTVVALQMEANPYRQAYFINTPVSVLDYLIEGKL